MISIICPTVFGREESLDLCRRSYERHTSHEFEFIVVRDRPTCGIAWNEGIDRASGGEFHLTADDIEATPAWDDVGRSWFPRRILPAPRVLNADGTTQSCGDDVSERHTGAHTELTRVPFFPLELLEEVYPIIETHYYTDLWVSVRARRAGWKTQVVREFIFYHHFAQAGRLDERLDADFQLLLEAEPEYREYLISIGASV